MCNVYAYLLSPGSAFFRGGGGEGEGQGQTPAPPPPANDPASYYLSEAAYAAMHGRLLRLEGRVLCALGFDTHAALPHALAVTYLQALDFLGAPGGRAGELPRRAVAHLNTALLSPQLLYLTHQPHALAVAAIYGAARDLGAATPRCAWWEVFDVGREELGFLVVAMRSVEGWARAEWARLDGLRGAGMVTRAFVDAEMRRRGLGVGGRRAGRDGGGNARGGQMMSEEEAMMRKMDETAVPMEE